MADAPERDLDLVLITGAGASRSFGAKRPYPLMPDWVEAILKNMSSTEIAHRQLLGLEAGMDGQRFEKRLGDFFREVQAFRAIGPLLAPSLGIFGVNQQVKMRLPEGVTALEGWFRSTDEALQQIVGNLNDTLFELFAGTRTDSNFLNRERAASGYRHLLQALAITARTRWVYATTNYDVVGESALEDLGFLPDWGRPPQLMNPSADAVVNVDRLVEGTPRTVPVLHLHGRIGWYERDGVVRDTASSGHTPSQGTPLVMWPDDKKDSRSYAASTVINSIWQQFTEVLSRARSAVILGHSLHDEYLITAIRERIAPDSVAVCAFPDDNGKLRNVETDRITEAIGRGVTILPVDFRETPTGLDQLGIWHQRQLARSHS